MTKDERQTTLLGMKESVYGKALKDFLDEHYNKINDIKTCLSWEETLGRKYALQLLKDLFSFMDDKNPSTKKPNPYI